MNARYWICSVGYALSFVLAFFAVMAAAYGPEPIRIPAGAAAFGFGWGARVFRQRLDAEYDYLAASDPRSQRGA